MFFFLKLDVGTSNGRDIPERGQRYDVIASAYIVCQSISELVLAQIDVTGDNITN